jgi:hypothetical protein
MGGVRLSTVESVTSELIKKRKILQVEYKKGGRRREENEWISSDPETSDLAEDVATPFY